MNVIEPEQSERTWPVIAALETDISLRMTIEYRMQNAITNKKAYHISQMDLCLRALDEAPVCSSRDSYSGSWKIVVDDLDKDEMTGTLPHGLFKCLQVLFGLKKAANTF